MVALDISIRKGVLRQNESLWSLSLIQHKLCLCSKDFLFVLCKSSWNVEFFSECSSETGVSGWKHHHPLLPLPVPHQVLLISEYLPGVTFYGGNFFPCLEYRALALPLAAVSNPLRGEASWKGGAPVVCSWVRREIESERLLPYIMETDSCEEQDSELQNIFKPFLSSFLS